MATGLRLDPELAEIVAEARRLAAELGEFPLRTGGSFKSPLPADARAIISEWLRDGGYATAIAEIGHEDPELANE